MPAMDGAALERFLAESFPDSPPPYVVEEVAEWGARLRLARRSLFDRPGGTVSGPSLMSLADSAAWVAILSRIGPVALSVTTSLHIDFLRKPPMADLVAEGRLLKVGRSLAVVAVAITSTAGDELVAQAQVTYSIPPDAPRADRPPASPK
ncbi:MAG: PaaI family thioesterase [Acidimicrobiales bacterium]